MASPQHPKAKMASPQHSTTIKNLPDDVLSNIFIWLLAKQLAQMRCLSKSLNALLSHSSFVKLHLDHSIHYNDEVLLIFHHKFSFLWRPFTARLARSPHVQLNNLIKLPVNPRSSYTDASVIGSVNGLICFKYGIYKPQLYIWNPSLSVVSTLPPSSQSDNYDMINIPPRFGYDPKTDDYKLVKVTVNRPPHMRFLVSQKVNSKLDSKSYGYKVEVYSMRKGSWKLISQRFPSHVTEFYKESEVCVDGIDGHLHWLGYGESKRKQPKIVSFDLGAETFREISLPNTLKYYNECWTVVGVLAGKLCMMIRWIAYGECDVWVMDEYGVAESWVKHHAFSRFTSYIVPVGFTLHNEFLFEVNEYHDVDEEVKCEVDDGVDDKVNDEVDEDVDYEVDDEVVYVGDNLYRFGLYNPSADKKTKIFKIRREPFKVVDYVDCLVWVAPHDHEMSSCSISRLKL